MAFKLADRVKQTTSTTGTSGVSLNSTVNGFRSFSSVLASGDTTFYVIEENDKFEVGLGTYGSDNLERTSIFSSTNSGAKITLGGSGIVSITQPANNAVYLNTEFNTVATSGIAFDGTTDLLKPVSGSLYWGDTKIGQAYTAGSGLTLVDRQFNVHGGSGHFINLEVNGAFTATTKSFLIDHPSHPGMKLQYGSLEGPENGVYVRGITSGNIIELPDYWPDLVDRQSITVNLTPQSHPQPNLYVESHDDNRVLIKSDREIMAHYTIFAERKDVEKLEVEHDES
tara:strand:+ start:14634 stop:15482 length:849 start_codon:yes stop_codon:yes gene_type:complete